MKGNGLPPRHTSAGLSESERVAREPVVPPSRLAKERISGFRKAVREGRPVPSEDLDDAQKWAEAWLQKFQSQLPVGIFQALAVLCLSAGEVISGNPFLLWITPLILVAVGIWIYGFVKRHRTRTWLARYGTHLD